MSKSQPVEKSATSATQIPAWLTKAAQDNIAFANNLPQFATYTGQGVAGPSANETQAFGQAGANVGTAQTALNPAVQGAQAATNFQLPGVGPEQIAQFFNPYQKNVVDASLNDINRARTMQRNTENAAAGSAGAFGSDRQGVVDALRDRTYDDTTARTVAGLNQSGYASAVDNAFKQQSGQLANAGLNLSGSAQLGQFAQLLQGMNASDLQGLLTSGGIQTGYDQAGKTFDYNEFLRQQNDPYKQLTARVGATNGAPHDTTTQSTETSQQYSNALGPALGLGLGIASLPMGGGVSFGGGLLKGLLS